MTAFRRHDGRKPGQLRPVRIHPNYVRSADGSCLIETGRTRVVCTACFVEGVPRWRKGSGLGWVTAEYGMLPASTSVRKPRPGARPDGRSVEIQRIIGRVLRCVTGFEKLGENTVYLDCDVLEADGGTRTAAITGACVALSRAVAKAAGDGRCERGAIAGLVAGVSVGIVEGRVLLDLDYREDAAAEVDMNVAMTSAARFVEVQGTGEQRPFDREQLDKMLRFAGRGIRRMLAFQREVLRRGHGERE